MTMTDINVENFRMFMSGDMPVVIDFWAEWCMPCRIFAPIMEEISDELDGKVNFGKLNVDKENVIAAECGIASIPTLVIFKGGEEKARLVGVRKKEEIIALIESFL